MDHVMDKRKTFMDVHQALDWVNALSEAESDGGEVSGLSGSFYIVWLNALCIWQFIMTTLVLVIESWKSVEKTFGETQPDVMVQWSIT